MLLITVDTFRLGGPKVCHQASQAATRRHYADALDAAGAN